MREHLHHCVRSARRHPGFTLAATGLIALAVGANATIFTIARTLVFKPLPFEAPDRLVSLWREPLESAAPSGASWPNLADFQLRKDVFEGVAAYQYTEEYAWSFQAGTHSGAVSAVQVTEDFFPLLGVRPVMGGTFSKQDFLREPSGNAPVPIIVGDDFWRERLESSPDVL